MKLLKQIFYLIASLMLAQVAQAREIPIEIHWAGTPPTQVLLDVAGGSVPLARSAETDAFIGKLTVAGSKPQRRTVTVRYGSFGHPFDFRVHRGLNRVVFFVSHARQKSCTSSRVALAGRRSDNLSDAVTKSVAAGELMSIPEPNACDADLRFGAIRARFHQYAKMAELSNGFFLINPDVERQYRLEARARGLNVDQEVASLLKQDEQLEARQLAVFRYAAQATGNYELALDVNDLIATRISDDATAAAFYKAQGLSKADVAEFARNLDAFAGPDSRDATPASAEDEEEP